MPRRFLNGVRVLDLSQYLPGPFATRMLADMGADVVKVEPPGGEPGRRLDREGRKSVSPYYHVVNAGKRVVELDLKSDADAARFAELAQRADVLLESFRPDVMERLGFDEQRLKTLNPKLIHCALSGFGQTGPLRLASGHDLNYVALTGMLSATGTSETPTIPFPPMADHSGAFVAVVSILGALRARDQGANGMFIDVSLSESLLYLQELAFAFDARRRQGLLSGGAACYQIYRTADDEFITISPLEPKFWANFCQALGHPEWTQRQYEPLPQTELIAEVAAVLATKPLGHWDPLLTEADCCYQPVIGHDQVPNHPHVRSRGLVGRLGDDWEILFPVFVDGMPPQQRAEVAFIDPDRVVASWSED